MSTATFRRSLTLTTALVSGVIGLAAARAQQVLPSNATVNRGVVTFRSDGVLAPLPGLLNGGGTRLDVDIASTGSVVTWGNFSVGRVPGAQPGDPTTPNIVSFNNLSGGTAAILNRVNAGGPASDIRGSIISDPNVAVYIANPNGITFGPGANVNVGALIAAALNVDAGSFTNNEGVPLEVTPATGSVNFNGGGSGVVVNGGTTFAIQDGADAALGQFVLLGASVQVDAGASLPAVSDAAFVAGSDITMTNVVGSPLAFTITTGTTVQNAITVAGSVSGRNVTLALASQDAIQDAILNVSGAVTATVATSNDRGVVLSAGQAVAGAVTLGGTDTSGVARVTGAAASTITTGAIDDGDPVTPPLSGNVTVAARSDVTLAGTVTAAGTYSVTSAGGGVTLGDTTAAKAQSATGAVSISAATGITGRQQLTLTSNSDGAGDGEATDVMRLTTTGAAAAIAFDASSRLAGGTTSGRGLINIVQADAAGAFSAGDLTASTFNSTTAGVTTQGITRNAALSFGAVDLVNAFVAVSGTSSVATGAVTVSGTNQGINLSAATTLTASGTLSATGDVSLSSAAQLNAPTINAGGSVSLTSTAGGVTSTAGITAGTLTVSGGDVVLGGAITANGAVDVTSSSVGGIGGNADLVLTSNADGAGAEALTLTTTAGGGAIALATGSSLIGGTVTDRSDIRIAQSAVGDALGLGNVTGRSLLGAIGAGGFVNGLTRTGSLTFGDVNLINAFAATSDTGNIAVGGVIVSGAAQGVNLTANAGSITG